LNENNKEVKVEDEKQMKMHIRNRWLWKRKGIKTRKGKRKRKGDSEGRGENR